ncbi:MAG: GHKL domain-containing protein [Desulfotignum sp.]|nr:GHKL domain-containing protein [Desulfotignum sp.]MCF8112672.1 GHKL domain-containing protein [Desulfotignum sp.]MCF8124927.1 GHKL domain-containing protein [Desulfotignum sp.]
MVQQLKWIILARVIFCIVLIFSSLVFSTGENLSFLSQPFITLYYLSAGILFLSVVYALWLNQGKKLLVLSYVQILLDTFVVTFIIYVTGSFDSMFTFLYLLIIIYCAMLVLQKGSLIIAGLSGIQYGLLVVLEYYRILPPFLGHHTVPAAMDPTHVMYRIIIIMGACFAVAFLSGLLAMQVKQARQDLKITRAHFNRVEKMEAMDEMISGIAHEIKNPLASLAGSIQLLREEARPDSSEDRLMKIILRETERLKLIANEIRLFAKPGNANAKPVMIHEAITDVVSLFLNTEEFKDRIQILTRMDETLAVNIDPVHLQQILWNLIKNAAQAIPDQGKIVITLTSPRGNRIYLTIQDNGQGIDPQKARHIFDPFFTTKPEGTGLGLSIIHRLIETYDGMIDFDSIPGKGTVFTIIFNNAVSEEAATKS